LQLSFVASALGFYFPYDFCVYNQMTPLASYFIRYIPLFTALILLPLLFIIRLITIITIVQVGNIYIFLYIYTYMCLIYRLLNLSHYRRKRIKVLQHHGVWW